MKLTQETPHLVSQPSDARLRRVWQAPLDRRTHNDYEGEGLIRKRSISQSSSMPFETFENAVDDTPRLIDQGCRHCRLHLR
jgi:hypothetical protein